MFCTGRVGNRDIQQQNCFQSQAKMMCFVLWFKFQSLSPGVFVQLTVVDQESEIHLVKIQQSCL